MCHKTPAQAASFTAQNVTIIQSQAGNNQVGEFPVKQ